MAKQGHSEPGLFGSVNHYDANGSKTGHSAPGLFGGYTTYDNKGNMVGHSDPGLFGGYTHYDAKGNKTGSSSPGAFGGFTHYDTNGKVTGHSDPGLFGSYSHSDGCYIATCVYGSYDCPEVWSLRRFRDDTLGRSAAGRAFIRLYYAVSPKLVKAFGKQNWFRSFWKNRLDRLVERLNRDGVENTPYKDRNWRQQS